MRKLQILGEIAHHMGCQHRNVSDDMVAKALKLADEIAEEIKEVPFDEHQAFVQNKLARDYPELKK